MMKHFSKWIEFFVLPQNFVELAATTFLNHVLACFGTPVDVDGSGKDIP